MTNATFGETRKTSKRILFALFFVALFFVAFVASASFAIADDGAALKSASELVELMRSRIGVDFDKPETFAADVLTAEQRDVKAIVFKSGTDWNAPEGIRWEWDSKTAPELNDAQRRSFGAISECKPAFGTDCVLIAASGGGVALVRVADKKVLFYGFAGGNTHSAALFPDGNVVAASSTGGYLSLFATPENMLTDGFQDASPLVKKIPLKDAHGVVWDAKRKTLWALGGYEIVGYEYVGTKENPDLKEIYRAELQGAAIGGHDLYPAPGYDALTTTGKGVSVFDPTTREFTEVSKMRSVKSLSVSPEGLTLMQRAVVEWWSETIIFGDAQDSAVGTYSGAKFYKARWFVPNKFSEP